MILSIGAFYFKLDQVGGSFIHSINLSAISSARARQKCVYALCATVIFKQMPLLSPPLPIPYFPPTRLSPQIFSFKCSIILLLTWYVSILSFQGPRYLSHSPLTIHPNGILQNSYIHVTPAVESSPPETTANTVIKVGLLIGLNSPFGIGLAIPYGGELACTSVKRHCERMNFDFREMLDVSSKGLLLLRKGKTYKV